MEGYVVFITGAANGIGLELARTFAEQKAKLALVDLDEEKVISIANDLSKKGIECIGIGCDITVENDLKDAIYKTRELYGSIHILINNAGIQHVSPIENFPTDKFEAMIRVMLVAPFIAIKHIFPVMKEQQWGRIINMASINGLIGFSGKAAYNSAKHGVIGLTKVAALEGAEYGITVNAVCPGYVDTQLVRNQLSDLAEHRGLPPEKVLQEVILPLVPQKRLLTVQEISAYVLFLCGKEAGGVTGQSIVIDGGYTVN